MKPSGTREVVTVPIVGFALGFALSRAGFSSWDQVHAMFTFDDPRLLLTFATASCLLALAWRVIAELHAPRWSPRKIHRGTVAGGAIFGIGWALSGACPSIAFVQLGEGQLGGALVVAGIFVGNFVYANVHARWFRWSLGSCLDD